MSGVADAKFENERKRVCEGWRVFDEAQEPRKPKRARYKILTSFWLHPQETGSYTRGCFKDLDNPARIQGQPRLRV